MKDLKNKKGFTLIELLAVIVVLAIVTVIATQSILPFMANAGRDAFASEANIAIDGASDAMSLMAIGNTDVKAKAVQESATTYCFTLQALKELTFFEKDLDDYEGTITVTVNGNQYTYAASMHNAEYYVNTTSGTVKAEDYDATNEPNGVGDYAEGVTIKTECTPMS